MRFKTTAENNLIYNSYLFENKNRQILSEEEQAAVIKQKFEQGVQSSDAQQAMLKQAQELQAKYKNEIDQALQTDGGTPGPAVEALMKKIQAELESQAQDQVKESIEIREGIFGRGASLVSGAAKKAGDLMSGKNSNLGFRQEAMLKHFQKLQTSLGSHLKELQRDMETTSGLDTKVKDAVNRTIANIESKHGIAPTSSKFQDLRHGVGKFVQNVATGALLAAPLVAAAAPLAAAVGLTGAGAAAVTAGLTGGSVSMLKDLINGQKPDAKRATIAAVGAAATAGLLKAGMDHFSGHEAVPDVTPDSTPSEIPTPSGEESFNTMHGTDYDPNSMMDARKLATGETLKSHDITGYSHNAAGDVVQVQSPIVQNFTDTLGPKSTQKVIDYINDMDPAQREEMFSWANRKSGKAIKELAKAIGDPSIMDKAGSFMKSYK